MTSIADGSVRIQTSSESAASPPSWFGEVVLLAAHLRKHDVLSKIAERVRFARRRFGRYEVIDFLAVLFGYAISGERTLEAFYERLQPFAVPFMALFERDQLPARSTLSRFLAALTPEPVEALRTLFLDDLESRPLSSDSTEKQTGGLVDRATMAVLYVTDIGPEVQMEQRERHLRPPHPPLPRREQMQRAEGMAAQEILEEGSRSLGGTEMLRRTGRPEREIVQAATEWKADIIIICSRSSAGGGAPLAACRREADARPSKMVN